MTLSDYQNKILEKLLDKYERSKQNYDSTEKLRAIMIKPTDIYKDYDSDYSDIDEQSEFETDISELVNEEYITIRRKEKIISRIVLNVDSLDKIYTLMKREPRKLAIQNEINLYKEWIGKNELISCYCTHQIELLKNSKTAKYKIKVAENLLRLLEFVLSNRQMILERELSIAVFGDTKIFEKEYRNKLLYVLKTYGNYNDLISEIEEEKGNEKEEREEIEHSILEELNIYSNPKYVYFKGCAEITFEDGNSYKLSSDIPIALPMDKLNTIKSFMISDSAIMTVENLASYNRIYEKDYFVIYLAGYHNIAKQSLIKLIASQNDVKEWYHFGDIDPDGFLILENLKKKTGINFKPVYMSINELKKYEKYTKKLEDNDTTKAQGLINKGLYVDIMEYMLKNNVKLEQEIVSWMNGVG
ncbi:Wadjet anti-phage system protein JetD domain-containing protein [Bovifimicola ammoniilytica]|uniref:Wadjet anti-phage system protein JetD domain-containing protein n=1 Tax=Bovifimicola ammoniilytica TaxID=2981720 RepID=UPI00082229E5|nr:Wadjet anti-phage system protein JetD domain-containing protein [Bovifimicola ammoniilytica]MCU6753789.1 DUF2220 domain-containing protein [Bovifimicola ammoniilytica]SCJ72829.1 Uncharacterized protein conserved in bacteria [uncultured Eubacterium sp.]